MQAFVKAFFVLIFRSKNININKKDEKSHLTHFRG